jgi:O-antigen/teichoic acid export membrane protein
LSELAAFSAASILALPLSAVLIVLGETTLFAVSVVLPLLASTGLAFWTISTLGITAASTARSLAMLLNFVLTFILLRRKIPATVDVNAAAKSILASTVMAAATFLPEIAWYRPILLPIYLIFGGVTYLISLRILRAVTTDDIELLRNVFDQRFETVIRMLCYVLQPQNQVMRSHEV